MSHGIREVLRSGQGSLNNRDIDGSYINPNRYVRARKDYNTLDYSDVTYGDPEGSIDRLNPTGLITKNPLPGKG